MDPTAAQAEVTHDFSFIGLFLQADPIVKGVMILLVIASIACWTVVFEKIIRIAAAKRQAKAFDVLVRSGGALESSGGGMTRRSWERPRRLGGIRIPVRLGPNGATESSARCAQL